MGLMAHLMVMFIGVAGPAFLSGWILGRNSNRSICGTDGCTRTAISDRDGKWRCSIHHEIAWLERTRQQPGGEHIVAFDSLCQSLGRRDIQAILRSK